jgi:hypothetical protein
VGDLAEGTGEGFAGQRFLALHGFGAFIHGQGHPHLGVAASVYDFLVLDSRDEHANGVMERTFCLVEDVLTTASQDDAAGFVVLATRELDDLVLTDHNLLNQSALSEDISRRIIKSG